MPTYTPNQNEIEITGLPDFFSGGQDWAGVTVIIPLSVSDPSQFYVKSLDGSSLKVDPQTAAQLYATSVAIRDLNYAYGPGQAYSYPLDWQQAYNQAQTNFAGQNILTVLDDFVSQVPALIPEAAGLAVPGLDFIEAAGIIDSVVSESVQLGTTIANQDLELSLALKYLQGAGSLLSSAEQEYQKNIYDYMTVPGNGILTPDRPISYSTVFESYYNTFMSIGAGQSAADELSTLSAPQPIWKDVLDFGRSALDAVISFLGGQKLGALDQDAKLMVELEGQEEDISGLVESFADATSAAEFEQALTNITAAQEKTVNAGLPFSQSWISHFETELANSPAETQGSFLGQGSPPPQAPRPLTLTAKPLAGAPENTPIPLSSIFSASSTPAYYNIILPVQGPGQVVVGGVAHTQGVISLVSPAQFKAAYYLANQSGTEEIDAIAFDASNNSSNDASATITTGANSTPPPTSTSSNLKISTASIVSSSLNAGGGGTIAFTVQNEAGSAAPGTAFSQIYLSSDSTLQPSDVLVSAGAISDAGLGGGVSESESLAFTLPANIAGSYDLIVFAGDSSQVSSGAVGGHTYAIPVTISSNAATPPTPASVPVPSGPSTITITTNAPITTRVGSEPAIEASALRAVDSQYSNDGLLRYVVVTPPSFGRLIDNVFTASTFTQADIDNGLVDYVQNGTQASSDSFSFYVVDPAGYRSPTQTFTFNILPTLPPPTPPAPSPIVTVNLANDTGLPVQGGPSIFTSDPTLAGTANPGATVALTDGSSALGSAVADSNGNWSFSPPSGFAQGGHSVSASVTISGKTATNFLSVIYDTVAPPAPGAPQLSLGGNVANSATPAFSGTSEANDEVLLLEGSTVIGAGTATPQGTWTIQAVSALGLGYHSITAQSVDQAGNISPVSSATEIEVVPPPPDQVTLNDAAMIAAGDLSVAGTVSGQGGTLTEYGPITAEGFSLTDQSRSGFAFVNWDPTWAFTHDVDAVSEYYGGSPILIVPTNGIIAGTGPINQVASAVADTIDLKRSNGSAFSLVSIDIGPTGNSPAFAVFTGTTATGKTISETFELNLPENSPLQPVALTGFNDVTDVKFTERLSSTGDPVSVAFDNIVLGDATPPPSPPVSGPLTSPITLDDATMEASGAAALVSSDDNVFSKSTITEYGPISVDGFTIGNIDRSDFSFNSWDSNFAHVFGYFYDGPGVLVLPAAPSTAISRIQIQRQDGTAFGISSIALDTTFTDTTTPQTATFTGVTSGGSTVTQTFPLDAALGMQTFQFGAGFSSLKSLQFTSTTGDALQFNDITLTPPTSQTQLPTLSVTGGQNAPAGQKVSLSSLVTVLDPSNVGYQTLELWDSNGTPSGGELVVNGVGQTGGHEIDVAAANVNNTMYDVGSVAGTDELWARLLQNDGTLTAWQQFTVTATQPDLVVSGITPTATTVSSGATFNYSYVVANQGTTATGSGFWSAAFLDGQAPGNVINGAWNSFGALAAGGTASASNSFVVPQNLSGGQHTLWIEADAYNDATGQFNTGGDVAESSESNNWQSVTFTVAAPPQPDLTVSSITPSAGIDLTHVATGSTLGFSYTVANSPAGGAVSTPFYTTAFLDGQAASNVVAYNHFIQSIAAGNTASASNSFVLPQNLSGGPHTLWIEADAYNDATGQFNTGGDVAESNESNNWQSITFTVATPPQPDLTVSSITPGPGIDLTHVGAGSTLSFSYTVANGAAGGAVSTPFYTTAFLDGQAASNVVAYNHFTQSIAAGNTASASNSFVLPQNLSGGPHTLWIEADAYNDATGQFNTGGDVAESNESNNWQSITFTVATPPQPDLTVSSITPGPGIDLTHVGAGSTLSFSYTVANGAAGGAVSTPFYTTAFLDGQAASNVVAYNHFTQSIAAGNTASASNSFVLPQNLSGGPHTLWIEADAYNDATGQFNTGGDVAESNESNNWNSITFNVTAPAPASQPNLVVSSITPTATSVTQGNTFSYSYVVANQGSAGTGSGFWSAAFLDGQAASNVINGAWNSFNALAANTTQGASNSFSTAGLSVGQHTLWIEADSFNNATGQFNSGNDDVTESSESDNWTGITFNVTAPGTTTALNDIAMSNAGALTIVNTFTGNGGTVTYYAPVTYQGFTLTNLNRSDFSVESLDAGFASTNGDFFDGIHTLEVPEGGSATVDTIRIAQQNGGLFSARSIDLDTLFATSGQQSATFVGTKSDNSTVTQTFNLDNVQGLQTFQFASTFTGLKYLDFEPTMNEYFDNLTLTSSTASGAASSASTASALAVGAGQTLELSSPYSGGVTFTATTGTLKIDHAADFTGTIAGMTGQDAIDLSDISFASVHTPTFSGTSSGGMLSVTDGTHSANIALLGNYTASSFVPSNDGNGGTTIVDPPMGTSDPGDAGANAAGAGSDAGGAGQLLFSDTASQATGAVVVADGSSVELVFSAPAASFIGSTGTLLLDHSAQFSGQISGFAGQDQIDLRDIAYSPQAKVDYASSGGDAGGALIVSQGGDSANIAFVGSYTASQFTISSDGQGGTLVTLQPASAVEQAALGTPQSHR